MTEALFDLPFDSSWGYERRVFLDNEHRYTKIHRLLRRRYGDLAGRRILDLGSCRGQFLTRFRRYDDVHVEGLEIVEDEARRARERGFDSRSHYINTFRGHSMIADLPFEDASFDVVVAGEIIEHVVDTRGFVEEIRRLLVPGGATVISTPNLAWWKYRLQLLAGRYPDCLEREKLWAEDFGHVRIFTRDELAGLLDAAGFVDVSIVGKRLGPIASIAGAPRPLARLLDRVADRQPGLCDDLIAFARRPAQS